jgi:hypothetical protein
MLWLSRPVMAIVFTFYFRLFSYLKRDIYFFSFAVNFTETLSNEDFVFSGIRSIYMSNFCEHSSKTVGTGRPTF